MKRTILLGLVLVLVALAACATPTTAPTPAPPTAAPAATAVPKPTSAPAAATAAPAATKPVEPTKPAAAGTPKSGGTLTFAMKEDVTSIDPLRANQYGDIRLSILVAQQLVAPDRTGKFVGVLAESWKTDDGKVWTFNLRKGVKFHNGQEMTADDVKWIFDRLLDEKAGTLMRSTYAGIGLKAEVVDKSTIKFTINSGSGPFLSYLALLNRSAIIHKSSYDAEGKVAKIIGTGPFMMDASKPGDSYTLKKFPDYWKKGEPLLDTVVLKVITDPNARLNAIRTGDVDMTEELPYADVKKLNEKQDPNFTTNVYFINSGERFVLNTKRAPFSDKNARLAVQAVFDRNMYNDAIFFGLGQVHNQPFAKTDGWYLDVPMPKVDLAKAKEYFAAAKLAPGTKLKAMLMANQKDRTELLQAMLGQIGFTVEFDVVDSAAWNKKGAAYDYDILIGTMTGIFDPDRPYGYLDKASGSNWLVGGYDSPKMADLLVKGRAEADANKRKEIYKQVVQLVQDDAATIYVAGLPWSEAWRNTVKGYKSGTSPALMMMDASDGLNVTWLDK